MDVRVRENSWDTRKEYSLKLSQHYSRSDTLTLIKRQMRSIWQNEKKLDGAYINPYFNVSLRGL